MTAQFLDTFILNNQEFSIVGVKGKGLFDPQRLGIYPVATCTACCRGYFCLYSIKDNKLILDMLHISLSSHYRSENNAQCSPEINGIKPTKPEGEYPFFDSLYEKLNLNIEFTGGILLGDGFIQELYVHMGFHPAWKYKTVFELIFDNGKVVERRDVSSKIQELRNKMVKHPLRPESGASKEEISSWIESTFKLDYEL